MGSFFGKKVRREDEKIYGLIGFPLSHSFSQTFFNQKFETEHINARYINFEIPDISDFMEIFSEYPSIAGLNVTIPYKQLVIPYLQGLDPLGDVAGFANSIRPLLKPCHKGALVLGSGGASRAVCVALEDLGLKTLVVSRTPREGMISYSDITPAIMDEYKVIVNTTPLGMYPHTDRCPDIPYDLINSDFLCYDLLYNPDVTLFMKKSAEHGAKTKNGLEMLLLQAFESWEIWTGRR